MPFSYKPSRAYDPREELDSSYQLALGVIMDDGDWEAEIMRRYTGSDFWTTPSEFMKQLNACTQDSIEIWIASIGGSLHAISRINEALQDFINKGGDVLLKNVAYAASAATLPFVVLKSKRNGGNVRSEISPTATMMIHNPRVQLPGPEHAMGAEELRAYALKVQKIGEYTDRQAANLADLYAKGSSLNIETVVSYMDAEHTFTAQEAVDAGLVGSVGSTSVYDGTKQPREDLLEEDDLVHFYSMVAMADLDDDLKPDPQPEAKAKDDDDATDQDSDLDTQADGADDGTQPEPQPEPEPTAGPEPQPSPAPEPEKEPEPVVKTDPPPTNSKKEKKMPLTEVQEAEIRATLSLSDDVEVTNDHVVQAYQKSQEEKDQIALERQTEEKVRLTQEIDEGLKPYFEAGIITAGEKANYRKTIMQSSNPKEQLASTKASLDKAMPAEPEPASDTKPDPEDQDAKLDLKADPKNGDGGQDPTPVEKCATRFKELVAEGDGSIRAYGRAYRILKREFSKEVCEEFETRGRIKLNTSENAKVRVEDLGVLERHQDKLEKKPIYI